MAPQAQSGQPCGIRTNGTVAGPRQQPGRLGPHVGMVWLGLHDLRQGASTPARRPPAEDVRQGPVQQHLQAQDAAPVPKRKELRSRRRCATMCTGATRESMPDWLQFSRPGGLRSLGVGSSVASRLKRTQRAGRAVPRSHRRQADARDCYPPRSVVTLGPRERRKLPRKQAGDFFCGVEQRLLKGLISPVDVGSNPTSASNGLTDPKQTKPSPWGSSSVAERRNKRAVGRWFDSILSHHIQRPWWARRSPKPLGGVRFLGCLPVGLTYD
jgi:hypothetical protein